MSDHIARNIVNQLGDLYMDAIPEGTPERAAFVKHRQDTNDQADQFVQRLLRQHAAQVLHDLADGLAGAGRPGSLIGPIGLRDLADVYDPDADRTPAESAPADPEWEYGFQGPIPALMYVSTNDMLIDTMHAARPHLPLYRRPVGEWTRVDGTRS